MVRAGRPTRRIPTVLTPPDADLLEREFRRLGEALARLKPLLPRRARAAVDSAAAAPAPLPGSRAPGLARLSAD
jgi:hypothetical protein